MSEAPVGLAFLALIILFAWWVTFDWDWFDISRSTTSMDHCRGFLNGMVRGCIFGPLIGFVVVELLVHFEYDFARGEMGLFSTYSHSCPIGFFAGGLLGALIGAIHDANRVKDGMRWNLVITLSIGFTMLVIVPCVLSVLI
jgi:hypothetical protein